MKKFPSVYVVMLVIGASSAFANHAAFENFGNSEYVEAVDAVRPEAPTSLSKPDSLSPESYVTAMDRNGDIICKQLKRVADALPSVGSSLSPKDEAIAKQQVRVMKIFCDKDNKFVGFPDSGNRNEKFVTDYYTITFYLTSASDLARLVIPGAESKIAATTMSDAKKDLDDNFYDGQRRVLKKKYGQLSDGQFADALTDYQKWSSSLADYYGRADRTNTKVIQ